MDKFNQVIDAKTIKFIIVGVVNTLFGAAVMFGFYNFLGLSYWVSYAANYISGSVLSYFLNKYWTFQNRDKSHIIKVKFVVNILVCYLFAYGIAKPLVRIATEGAGREIQENAAMYAGMILFVVFNYLGQRYFAFRGR